jgi:hypothetical protein
MACTHRPRFVVQMGVRMRRFDVRRDECMRIEMEDLRVRMVEPDGRMEMVHGLALPLFD